MFLVWGGHEDGLHVSPHVQFCEESVTLIEDEMLHFGEVEDLWEIVKGCGKVRCGEGNRRRGVREGK